MKKRCCSVAAVLAFLLAVIYATAQGTPSKIAESAALARIEALTNLPSPEWRMHEGAILNAEDPNFNDSSWRIAKPGTQWTSGTAWFRATVELPTALQGYDLIGTTIYFQFQASGETAPVTIYFNGSRIAMGEELEPVILFRNARLRQKITIAVKVPSYPGSEVSFSRAIFPVKFAPNRPDPGMLRQEIIADEAILQTIPQNQPANLAQIQSAVSAIDLPALDRGNQTAFDSSLKAAQSKLEPLRPILSKLTIHATGNSHIDMAWLWPATETVEVVRNTFRTSLQLMDEYPEYTFSQSTAQASEWMEEKYPDLFEQINKRVQEGRWELVGGMWVEPDLNMPDGESLVRQILLGKRYFREKFGKDVRIGWNPDSFGYSWQLPQIYKKSGIDYFVTQKLEWNDTNKPTRKLFWWESPDGSRILTYFPHDYVNTLDPVRMGTDLADARRKLPGLDGMMHLYGIGDHGGGPTRWMLNEGRKWTAPSVVYPRLEFGTAQAFFDDAERKAPGLNLPVWNSEMYFEYHRGVFTSQAETKKRNRESEELVLNAEKFSALAYLAGNQYPGEELNKAWKNVLFNQFHDIAAGSGIAVIYKDAARGYEETRLIADAAMKHALATLSTQVDTSGNGAPIIVFNPLSWQRSDVTEATVQLASSITGKSAEITDAEGRAMPGEILSVKPETGVVTVRFLARDVPSLGFKVFYVRPGLGAGPSSVSANGTRLENEFLHARVDPQSGCITSLIDKQSQQEAIASGGCGNLLQAFRDVPKDWDAWNIDADFENQKWDLNHASEVRLLKQTPLEAVIRVVRKFQNSTFTQDVVVTAGIPRVDIRTRADWQEKHILLKAAFPLSVQNEKATYEIPYGSIERPTTRRNSFEKAMFEVPALRWADISDGRHGFSLLNDCKYGYDGKDNVLRLSLLRAPTWPDPHADEGVHEFTYSLYPHAGDWRQAKTVRQGYELNYKLIAFPSKKHSGTLGSQHSYLEIEPENVVVTAWKKAEDSVGLILRFYEWEGKDAEVRIRAGADVKSAAETNLMEAPTADLPVTGGVASLRVKPYEIKSVKLTYGR